MTRTSLHARAIALLITVAAVLAPAFAPATSAAAVAPRASLTDVESYLMCTSCREPLQVAQSPQADSERAYIRALIAQGETKSQIINNMVAQYGTAVLGKPPAHGFNLTVYIIPPAILVIGAGLLAFTLPRWRRRTRAAAREPTSTPPELDATDARRLDQELSQFRG